MKSLILSHSASNVHNTSRVYKILSLNITRYSYLAIWKWVPNVRNAVDAGLINRKDIADKSLFAWPTSDMCGKFGKTQRMEKHLFLRFLNMTFFTIV